MAKLLVIEDDDTLRDSIVDYLSFDHHSVEHAKTLQEALDKLSFSQFEALVLDWDLPDGSGVDLLKRFRAKGGTAPILMLTGKDKLADKEVGFSAGADDYLTKPFAFKEMVMRVNALLRRPQALLGSVLTARNITLDPTSYHITKDGTSISLLPREFALLQFLMRNPHMVFSAEALLSRVWETEVDVSPAAVVACISRLRQKLEKKGDPPLFRNIHGVGYKFEP